MIDSMETLSFLALPAQNLSIGEAVCLSFSYFTSTYYSKVKVYIKKDNRADHLVWISTKPSKYVTNIGSNWRTDFIEINNNENMGSFIRYEVIFEFVRGPNQVEEMAVDDIFLEKSMCISKKY